MNTAVQKDPNKGWVAMTTIDMGSDRLLIIETSKSYRGGVQTVAAVHRNEGGFLCHTAVLNFGSCLNERKGDFRQSVAFSPCTRITENAVRAQHIAVLEVIDPIKTMASDHYNQEEPCHA